MTDLYSQLLQQDDAAWARCIAQLQPSIHPVDRNATRIWFAFYPVKLWQAFSFSEDPEALARKLILKGRYLLRDQVDSSSEFLYGHRHWPQVKAAVAEYASSTTSNASLPEQIKSLAGQLATKLRTEQSLLVGVVTVAFGSLQQVGPELFSQPAAPGRYGKGWNQNADQIVADRAKDAGQGFFGFLKTVNKEYTVNFREFESGCTFQVIDTQDVTMAAAEDKRDHTTGNPRCVPGQGPIPVECRTAACGTCWVGVLSPAEKISPPNDREKNKWVYFGYEGFTGESDSPIRLACQMKAYGNVTIVIPPWCGMIGKLDGKEETAAAAG